MVTVLSQNYTTEEKVNIEHLPKAIYFVNLYSEGKLVGVKKLVKND